MPSDTTGGQMSKITFRADDDLIQQLEEFDASKSQVMREALRAYLGEPAVNGDARASGDARDASSESLDDLVRERVDEAVADRVAELLGGQVGGQSQQPSQPAYTPPEMPDINVNVSLDGVTRASDDEEPEVSVEGRKTRGTQGGEASDAPRKQCAQCGENVEPSHVYCPNCGAKSSNRVFCECGDELRSDWSFCPGCGRRTAAADVLDRQHETQ